MDDRLSPGDARTVAPEPDPHELAIPAPPQSFGSVQVPQASVPPHPSGMVPQSLPRAAHVDATHPDDVPPLGTQTFALHVSVPEHVPQLSVPPQPSAAVPQLLPREVQVLGVHDVPEPVSVPASQACHRHLRSASPNVVASSLNPSLHAGTASAVATAQTTALATYDLVMLPVPSRECPRQHAYPSATRETPEKVHQPG